MSSRFVTAARQIAGPRHWQNDSFYVGDRWVALADGVGAEARARSAAETAVAVYAAIGADLEPDDVADRLLAAPVQISDRLAASGEDGASTIVAVVLDGRDRLWLSSVGDSRVALFRDGDLLATNHLHNAATWVRLTDPSAVPGWGAASSLTRAVSMRRRDVPEIQLLSGRAGDVVVLLSDGIDAKLTLDEVAGLVESHGADPTRLCDEITGRAADRDLGDNATCVVARLEMETR